MFTLEGATIVAPFLFFLQPKASGVCGAFWGFRGKRAGLYSFNCTNVVKGGIVLDIKGSKTEENLITAFKSKAFLKNMYDSYAYRCAYSGLQQVQNAMYDTAKLEGTHAKILYEFLYGQVKDTKSNVKMMLEDEINTGAELYECARVAEEEGLEEAARVFEETAKIHDEHIKVYEQLVYNFENERVFKKDDKVDWVCIACGYVVHDREPAETCPYCEHPKGLFYIKSTNF